MKQSFILKQNLYIKQLEEKIKQAKTMIDELLAENKKLVDHAKASTQGAVKHGETK